VSPEKDVLRRLHDALYHLRRGLGPFVVARMQARYGEDWTAMASRAGGGRADGPLDDYALLKTMIDRWREAFEDAFGRERHRVRSFISLALEGQNALAHSVGAIEDDAALRYIDAFHQLLRATDAPAAEIAAVRAQYDAQRFAGAQVAVPPVPVVATPTRQAPAPRVGIIEERVLDFVRRNPGLDDDELSSRLGIHPRQSVNMAARRLESRGLFRRHHGPRGKIVNTAKDRG
jgi:hypothetical protein